MWVASVLVGQLCCTHALMFVHYSTEMFHTKVHNFLCIVYVYFFEPVISLLHFYRHVHLRNL